MRRWSLGLHTVEASLMPGLRTHSRELGLPAGCTIAGRVFLNGGVVTSPSPRALMGPAHVEDILPLSLAEGFVCFKPLESPFQYS